MGTITKKIVLSGYYGFQNSGDEAVLQSILFALEEAGQEQGIQFEPIVLSNNPSLTEDMYGVRAVHRMKLTQIMKVIRESDGLISGGGSLLQDTTGMKSIPYYLGVIQLAQWMRKPVFIFSQGIGPIHRRIFYPWIRTIYNRCQYVSVRDQASASLLRSIGLKKDIDVVSDAVMGLSLPSINQATASDSPPILGVSVRFWKEDRSELKRIAEALVQLVSIRPVEIRFLPFHVPADLEASLYVMEQLKQAQVEQVKLVEGILHPQEMVAQVGSCDVMIGMRLHSLIYAASQMVPMIGISYDPKVDQFLQQLNMEAAASTEDINTSQVVELMLHFLDEKKHWVEEKQEVIKQLKKNSQIPAQQISLFMRSKG